MGHAENRKKICIVCGFKAKTFRSKKTKNVSSVSNLNKKYSELISDFLLKDGIQRNFLEDVWYPTVICSTCRVVLDQHSKKITTRKLPRTPKYEEICGLRAELRSGKKCECYICKIAESKNSWTLTVGKVNLKRGRVVAWSKGTMHKILLRRRPKILLRRPKYA